MRAAAFAGLIGLILMVFLIGPLFIWGLWDNTFTAIFGVRDITFVEAIFISIISAFLFKSTVNVSNS